MAHYNRGFVPTMKTLILAVPAADEGPAKGPDGESPSLFSSPMMLILLAMVFFLFLMPLFNKKEKHRRKRLQGLKKHDKVVTSGGIFGTIAAIDEHTVTLEVSKDMRIKIKRTSVFDVESPGDAKAAAAAAPKKAGAKS